jgi:hypothetical protein
VSVGDCYSEPLVEVDALVEVGAGQVQGFLGWGGDLGSLFTGEELVEQGEFTTRFLQHATHHRAQGVLTTEVG